MHLSLGVLLTNYLCNKGFNRRKCNQILVLFVTFFIYFVYRLARRPLAVIKPKLSETNCTQKVYENETTPCGWPPFNGADGDTLLGALDMGFLATYAVFLFVSGYIAERSNLRYYLSINLILLGILSIMAGMAKPLEIHGFWYFLVMQILSGIASASGWPAVVTAVGNWFGKSKRGLIFGIWSWHTSLGNIAGAAIAGVFVESNWSLSFFVPGVICIGMAVIVFAFLIPSPSDVGLGPDEQIVNDMENKNKNYKTESVCENSKKAISFLGALKIPGVIEFSLCLLFVKVVSFTFLYWLPKYINESMDVSASKSAYLSIAFDIGGPFGAMITGYMADKSGASAITCIVSLIFAIPSLLMYYTWGGMSMAHNICIQFICGLFVNGPYSLIMTAVSADLGTRVESKQALATIAAIIDGVGAIGAAIGPALAGWVAEYGWKYVFIMLMVSDFFAVLTLLRTGWHELKKMDLFEKLKNKF